jgi:tetratricopeptide (TPR) repeat protein
MWSSQGGRVLALLGVLLGVLPAPAWTDSAGAVIEALGQGEYQRALRLLEPLLRAAPEHPRLLTLKGLALARLRRQREALDAYRAALKRSAGYLPALQGAAEVEYELRDPEATKTLQRILRQDAANPTAHAMLGVLAFEQQDCEAATKHFAQAQAIVQSRPEALWQYGHCLLVLGRIQEAIPVFERLVSVRPEEEAARYNLALALHQLGRQGDAAGVLQPLLAIDKPKAEVLNLAAAIFEADHQTPQAVETLQRAIRLYPSEEGNYLDLADICLQHDSPGLALEILNSALRQMSPSARLYAMRGVVHAQLGQLKEAEADFENALVREPLTSFARAGLSLALQRAGRDQEAISKMRHYVKDNPSDVRGLWMLAQLLMQAGASPGSAEFQEALSALLRAIERDPAFSEARVLLGRLYLLSGETERAVEQLRRAVEQQPDNRTAIYQLATALRQVGQPEESRALLARVRALVQKEAEQERQMRRYRLLKVGGDFAR